MRVQILCAAFILALCSTAAALPRESLGVFDTLKLKNFQPESRLQVPEHPIVRARYPVIDSHSHTYLRGEEIHRWVRMMKACNVRKVVILTGAYGEGTLGEIIEDYLGKYPNHFQIWAKIDDRGIDEPDYPERAARSVEEAYRLGARGIGEYKDMGWGFGGDRKKGRKGLNIDDPRWDLALETAGRLGMPISIHTADMEDCYYPLTATSELGVSGAPWNVYERIGKGVMPRAEVLNTRNRAVQKHPNTIFIGCHVGNLSHDLNELGRLLEQYPNFNIDISARAWDLGRQPFTARRFFIRYQDRILFGTDLGPDEEMYRGWFRLLETEDEFFRVPDAAWWMNYGLNLPDEVLRKVYYGNAVRLFKDMGTISW
ncbi:MAG: amidohydrolase family protein [Candidatus Glassbacteria bacterium]|nr:amidohydrolase family protein [Candidatus Glassbacteria bacterium]